MTQYTLDHLSDAVLLRDLTALVSHDRVTSATLLAHLAEVDTRRLYVPAGYSSMFAYCVGELLFSDESAGRRIHAARTARRFPVLFKAVADGRLHLTAVCLLAPHLTPDNIDELIDAAAGRRKAEIEEDLVRRFPFRALKWNDTATIRPIGMTPAHAGKQNASVPHAHGSADRYLADRNGGGVVASLFDEPRPTSNLDAPPPHSANATPGSSLLEYSLANAQNHPTDVHSVDQAENRSVAKLPIEPREARFLVRLTIRKSTHDKLREAQALLTHSMPAGDVAEVLDRALDALLPQLRKRKHGGGARQHASPANAQVQRSAKSTGRQPAKPTTQQPAESRERSKRNRYIPARIRREVWARDQGRCTFAGPSGHRCSERRFLEFDHVHPVARGGEATVDTIRLRCRAHNQYEAERAFGREFMRRKRHQVRHARAEAEFPQSQGGT